VNEASGADAYLIMVIFRAASSRDICGGAYRATSAEYSLMLEEAKGLRGRQTGESRGVGVCFS
jgi:hypothetical protein